MIKFKNYIYKSLYIFFIVQSLIIFFFSTTKAVGKSFAINNIEISRPFEMNFNKNEVIDEGFKKAFSELVLLIVNSSDQKKIENIQVNQIKGMVESFSFKEEKFIDESYYVNLGVEFNKKKVFNFLEKNNIFPSTPIDKNFLFVPIIIEENTKDLFLYSKNQIYSSWNKNEESYHLINYVLPTEDLDDLKILTDNSENIEEYNFKEIINKYDLDYSIIALFFKKDNDLRVLSRISIKDDVILKNQKFLNTNLNDYNSLKRIINDLKTQYEDYWKNLNQINTSIRLILNVKANTLDNSKISDFEKKLSEDDLVHNFYISKFDKDFIYYRITFNGTPNNFLKSMNEIDYEFNTQNKIWTLK